MIINGEKIRLRPIEMSDLDRLLNINDSDIRANLALVFPLNRIREEEWIRSLYSEDRNIVFAVEPIDETKLIGTVGLHSINWVNRTAEFGIAITDKNYWNKGLGTEATLLILRYGFLTLNLHRISLHVYEYNKRAIHVYEKCGFKHEGVLREARYYNGKYHDVIVMGILADEFLQMQK
ncbi:GNAT family N-acetyltransferase [Pseudothermotoga thermarum]|uniref:GCN5-related N-acetyltransferase n=1 Tax=Pseudothermotoga thermarum DSM 5069 TaxID=688269 RepID=F7YXU8_9THEM|nr:GNAT family protein [Pseudothermotoga thermarum]AEH50746.1 GCN5-related N-acetyltransferase [Pseudothermotoga thermarum DSM 5069]